jgi:hypothetical protein
MKIARDPYIMAWLGLINAKKTPSKISRLGTFNALGFRKCNALKLKHSIF